ncbi:hypothetical protein ABWH89_21170 [Hoeflea alexandrii]|uniref:hypothetical protein n=1 Tax=Hoeflea alexandrii TaxID=288436 RepID=UPI0035CF185A
MWKIFLATATIACGVASQAMAEEKALVAECTGNGARFFLSDLTIDEASVAAGTELPSASGGILIIGAGRKPEWSMASRRQIDRECGGQGQEEVELLPGGLQPRDGNWRTVVKATRMEGCPEMLANAMAAQNKGPETTTRRVSFPNPFDPNKLPRDFNPGHSWSAAGNNRWTASIFTQGIDYGAEGAQKTNVRLTMELVSETEIRTSGSVKMTLPKFAQKVMNISGDCRVITNSVSTWVGD